MALVVKRFEPCLAATKRAHLKDITNPEGKKLRNTKANFSSWSCT